ncbi:MAG: hypothetical protein GC204_03720 [Chloroflexi bacterium]|nr:hypothetical protein [Chloroflexota bacterium]
MPDCLDRPPVVAEAVKDAVAEADAIIRRCARMLDDPSILELCDFGAAQDSALGAKDIRNA